MTSTVTRAVAEYIDIISSSSSSSSSSFMALRDKINLLYKINIKVVKLIFVGFCNPSTRHAVFYRVWAVDSTT